MRDLFGECKYTFAKRAITKTRKWISDILPLKYSTLEDSDAKAIAPSIERGLRDIMGRTKPVGFFFANHRILFVRELGNRAVFNHC